MVNFYAFTFFYQLHFHDRDDTVHWSTTGTGEAIQAGILCCLDYIPALKSFPDYQAVSETQFVPIIHKYIETIMPKVKKERVEKAEKK